MKTLMSRSTPAANRGSQQILTIDWRLLWRRLSARGMQLTTSARHRAANTEYIPPSWMTRLRLSWFRIGLIALALFVFTQKQIDFTVSVGADGVGTVEDPEANNASEHTATLSMLPAVTAPARTAVTTAPVWSAKQYDTRVVQEYVERFTRVARTEESKFGIPVAANLAMAILESEAGQSAAAVNDNNHFSSVRGEYFDNAWASWREHSEDLSRRFPELAHEGVNYQQWVAALGKTGYSRDAHYTQKLLSLIERFDLDEL